MRTRQCGPFVDWLPLLRSPARPGCGRCKHEWGRVCEPREGGEDRTFAVWTDTRAGTEASGKQDLRRAVAAFSDPADLSPLEKDALRYGGLTLALLGLVLVKSKMATVLFGRRDSREG